MFPSLIRLVSSSDRRCGPHLVRANDHAAIYQHSQPSHGGQNTVAYQSSSSKRDDRKRRDRKGKGKSYHDSGDEDYDTLYSRDPDDDAAIPGQGATSTRNPIVLRILTPSPTGQGDGDPDEEELYSRSGKTTRQFCRVHVSPVYYRWTDFCM